MQPFDSYRFGEFEVQVARRQILRNGQSLHTRAKTFQVLLYLLERRDRGVTKQELFDAIWQDVAVSEGALVQCNIDPRKILGDDSQSTRFFPTVLKVGCQVVGER